MKRILSFIFIIFLMLSCGIGVAGAEENLPNLPEEIYSAKDELFSVLDSDIKRILEEMGIDEDSFLSYHDVSLSGIGNFFKTTLKDKAKLCLKNLSSVFCVVFILGAFSVIFQKSNNEEFLSLLSCAAVSILSVSIVSDSLYAAVSVLKLSGNFMVSFIPIYTLMISFGVGAASALSYNTVVLLFAEMLSGFLSSITVDVMGVFFCLAVTFSMNENFDIGRLTSFANKTVSFVLGFFSSVFTAFLSIKGILSAGVDSVSVKSIRFLISSLIPVVGSSISEAYSSVLGSINLIKGSVAVVGILAVLVINLPVIMELLIYYSAFSLFEFISESCRDKKTSEILSCFSCGMRIILLLCVFEMFILIISTGIMLTFKTGG